MYRKGFFKSTAPSFLTYDQKEKIRDLYFQVKQKEFFEYIAQIEKTTIDKYYLQYIQGWFYKRLDDYEKAEEYLQSALEIYKKAVIDGTVERECGNYQIVTGKLYHEIAVKKGDWKGKTKEEVINLAIEYYLKGIKLGGMARPVHTLNNLGECYEMIGKEEEGIIYYGKAIEKDKEDYWAYEKLAAIYERKGDLEKAKEFSDNAKDLKQAQAQNPTKAKIEDILDMDSLEIQHKILRGPTNWRNTGS